MKVDADYSPKPYEQWKPSDWPKTYQSVKYDNVWAAGIAFAPPHQMSKPHKTLTGPRSPCATAHRHAVRGDRPGGREDHR